MPDQPTPVAEPTPAAPSAPAPVTPPAGALNPDTPSPEPVPYARFKEINDELKAIKDAQAQAETARQAEDERKLAQQAEWQTLAQNRQAKIDELKPQAELAGKLSEMVAAQYAAEIKDWPEQVRRMAPADSASILDKLDWMNKAKPLAVELMADKTPIPGNGRRPKVTGASGSRPAPITPITDVKRNF